MTRLFALSAAAVLAGAAYAQETKPKQSPILVPS
jgi:hypothetical protein